VATTRPSSTPSAASRFEHYVPQVYLKKFVATRRGRNSIYCYDKFSKTSRLRNIASVAGARNFYEAIGTSIGGIEAYLGRIESDFGPARDRLLASEDVNVLTEGEKRILAYFVATQFVRTREVRWLVRDLVTAIKTSLIGEKVSDALMREIEEAQGEQSIQGVHLSMLKDVPRIAGTIMERKWIVILNRTSMPFWTSDHPVNLRNEIEPPGLASHGIGLPEVQVYLPLSPLLSLLICDYRYYMYERDKLLATDINNVIFQNDWQLRQATQHIFSNTNDFALARRITAGIPEIADTTRNRVETRRFRNLGRDTMASSAP
jgi:hypothetical protein